MRPQLSFRCAVKTVLHSINSIVFMFQCANPNGRNSRTAKYGQMFSAFCARFGSDKTMPVCVACIRKIQSLLRFMTNDYIRSLTLKRRHSTAIASRIQAPRSKAIVSSDVCQWYEQRKKNIVITWIALTCSPTTANGFRNHLSCLHWWHSLFMF